MYALNVSLGARVRFRGNSLFEEVGFSSSRVGVFGLSPDCRVCQWCPEI